MFSNLPPGVNESDIPGNRPEDQECEVVVLLAQYEIDDLCRLYNSLQETGTMYSLNTSLIDVIKQIVDQATKHEKPQNNQLEFDFGNTPI